MKTAISIPDPIFEAVEKATKSLGVSRSEFITNALKEYLQAHRYEGITEKLNELCDEESDRLDPIMETMQWMSLPKEKW